MDAAVCVTTVRKKHRRIGAGTVVIYLVLIFWAVLTIFPFVWVVLNSFKPSAEVLRSSFSLPETFTWMNYQTAFERLNVLRAYRYSFVISRHGNGRRYGIRVADGIRTYQISFQRQGADPQPHRNKSDVSGIFHDHSGI